MVNLAEIKIKKGSNIVITGPTASGKTAFANLLLQEVKIKMETK